MKTSTFVAIVIVGLLLMFATVAQYSSCVLHNADSQYNEIVERARTDNRKFTHGIVYSMGYVIINNQTGEITILTRYEDAIGWLVEQSNGEKYKK